MVGLVAFGWSVMGNLSYPLFWNDEGETAELGRRVLKYGIPKADDGKNWLNLMEHDDPLVGIDEKSGAYVGVGWVQYYVSAIGAGLAEKVEGNYKKTMWHRLPFAILGIAGVGLLGWAFIQLIPKNREVWMGWFLWLEAMAVPIGLHMREARYHSVVMFWTGVWLWVSLRYLVAKKISYGWYVVGSFVSLAMLFNSQYMAYFSLVAGMTAYLALRKIMGKGDLVKNMLPIIMSGVVVLGMAGFYQIPKMLSNRVLEQGVTLKGAAESMTKVVVFGLLYGYGMLAVALVLIGLRTVFIIKGKGPWNGNGELRGAIFMSCVLVVVYGVMILRIPVTSLYERYFLVMQPIGVAGICLGWYLLRSKETGGFVDELAVGIGVVYLLTGWVGIYGRIYELTHAYKGPVDELVSYINENYPKPETLIIATNYEEPSYMYYLNSRVIVGYLGKRLEKDARIVPDIVILRKFGGIGEKMRSGKVLLKMISEGNLERNALPMFDYPVNNIPEMTGMPRHLFMTPVPRYEEEKIEIFERGVAKL